jgi:hypothetical protein
MSTAFALQDLSDIVGTGWTTRTLTARARLAKVAIAKSTAQMMCTDAGFHPDQARRHVGEPRFHLAARPLLSLPSNLTLIEGPKLALSS